MTAPDIIAVVICGLFALAAAALVIVVNRRGK
jgi:hypothetical protein